MAGCPKVYPNAYLLTDTFVDTIKDSNHKNLEIVFNPEFMKVLDVNGNDLNVLKVNSESFYQLQLINVDLQTQENIKINLINNRR